MPTGSLSIQTYFHHNPRGNWITFNVLLAGTFTLAMVLDPGSPVSAISPGIHAELRRSDLLREASRPRYFRLAPLSIGDQPFPDLEVRVLPRLGLIDVDGLVGLDFLRQFAAIHFYVATLQLVLDYP